MAVNDIFRCELRYEQFGSERVNVLHFVQLTPQGANGRTELRALRGAVNAALETYLLPILNATLLHVETYVFNLADPTTFEVSPSSGTGGRTGVDALPAAVCYLVNLKTGRRGRSYQGRVYLPGFSVDNITNGLFAGVEATIDDFFDQLTDATVEVSAGDATFALAVYSPKLLEANIVTLADESNNPATQRRRRVGSGS